VTRTLDRTAVSATLHCLTGCAIGEIAGMLIGTAAGSGNAVTVPLSIVLAFCFGYTLSTLPLLRSGMAVGSALRLVLAADTLSILTMEAVDNVVMLVIPGAIDAGLVNVVFWVGLMISLVAAFAAAYPVNAALLRRGKGHALTHEHHHHDGHDAHDGAPARPWIPSIPTGSLAAVIAAFLLGGLVVAIADSLS
jgi:hypothetical protein